MNKKERRTRDDLYKTKPYMVVVHPSGSSAAYNRKYEKILENVSPGLIAYAQQHNTQVSAGFRLTLPEQQPSWMLPGLADECTRYHLYNDSSSLEDIKSVPNG